MVDSEIALNLLQKKMWNIIRKKNQIQLSFPYMIFVIEFKEGQYHNPHVFYSNKPLESLNDPVFEPNLPNIEGDQCSVCLKFTEVFGSNMSLSDKVNRIVSYFWQSAFNKDYCDKYLEMKHNDIRFKDIFEWEKNSQENPQFILEVNWQSAVYTLAELIDRITQITIKDKKAEFETIAQQAIEQTEEEIRRNCP